MSTQKGALGHDPAQTGGVAPAVPGRRPGRPRLTSVEDQRRQVLAAATRLFARHGVHGTTNEAVAREAGVARPTVYDLFGPKDDLFVAVVEHAVDVCRLRIGQHFDRTPGLPERERVRSNVAALFDLLRDEPDAMAVIRMAPNTGVSGAGQGLDRGYRLLQRELAVLLAANWPGDELAPDDAHLLAVMLHAAVQAAGVAEVDEPTRSTGAAIDFITDFILGGLYGLSAGPDDHQSR